MRKWLRRLFILVLLVPLALLALRWAVLPGALQLAQAQLQARLWPEAVIRQPGWAFTRPRLEVYANAAASQPVMWAELGFTASLLASLAGSPVVFLPRAGFDCANWPKAEADTPIDWQRWLKLEPIIMPALPAGGLALGELVLTCAGVKLTADSVIIDSYGDAVALDLSGEVESTAGKIQLALNLQWDIQGDYEIFGDISGGLLQLTAGSVLPIPSSYYRIAGGQAPLFKLTAGLESFALGDLQLSNLTLNLNEAEKTGLRVPLQAQAKLGEQELKLTGQLDLPRLLVDADFTGALKLPALEAVGLKATIQQASLWPLKVPDNQQLSITALQLGGLPLTAVQARFGFAEGQLRLQQAGAMLFGGRVEVEPLRVRLPPVQLKATLNFKELDLSQLIQLGNVEGLGGEGRISGQVPVEYKNGRLSLGATELAALQTGHIRYQPIQMPSFMAPGGSGEMLGQVFSDFAYDGLTLKLGGTLGDNLTLGVRLAGKNPSFYNGHPVVFNLNLSGALESLLTQGLQSFRFTPEALGELVREGAQP